MITLYHSPHTRSTSVLSLLRMMGKETHVKIEPVHVRRQDGSGKIDPRNPHPEGKVPVLLVDSQIIRERAAIMLWLTDHFESQLGRSPSSPSRGAYLSWLFYYGNVMEPVFYTTVLGVSEHPIVREWCRDSATMFAAIETALSHHEFLVDDQISAVDILVASPLKWFPDMIPDSQPVRDWMHRCDAAQDQTYISEREHAALEALNLPLPAV
ncbi:MAG: glutathione binding-like protein [Pseudomonadota bacterium]